LKPVKMELLTLVAVVVVGALMVALVRGAVLAEQRALL
jgi:hypothetical protein